jgi:hypothetical protein
VRNQTAVATATTSSDCCPACGQALPDIDPGARDELTLMRAACVVMRIQPTWDDHVSERDAARLLNRSPQTLRNRRGLDCPLPFRKRGGRIEYALSALCGWGEDEKSTF